MAALRYAASRIWALLSAAPGGSDHIVVPDSARAISVTVHPGARGNATLAVTCSPAPDVEAGSAVWTDVSIAGATVQTDQVGIDLQPSVTAIRLRAAVAAATARVSILS